MSQLILFSSIPYAYPIRRWRVTEISSILLVLLDSRCPPLHYPPSFHAYLSALRPARKIVLVLTKTDIVGPERVDSWKTWLRTKYPGCKVVGVESYRKQQSSTLGEKGLLDLPRLLYRVSIADAAQPLAPRVFPTSHHNTSTT